MRFFLYINSIVVALKLGFYLDLIFLYEIDTVCGNCGNKFFMRLSYSLVQFEYHPLYLEAAGMLSVSFETISFIAQ